MKQSDYTAHMGLRWRQPRRRWGEGGGIVLLLAGRHVRTCPVRAVPVSLHNRTTHSHDTFVR
eukprot:2960067-Prymnesium_polylepis.1